MKNIFKKLKKRQKTIRERKVYSTQSRIPFFLLAGEYLPSDSKSVVVDIGSGLGLFAKTTRLAEMYENYHLLDGSKESVDKIPHTTLYRAPDPLPFKNESVDYVHCSHLIEHLYYEEVHTLLKEVDRVLRPKGVFVISTPLLWEPFYGNLTHVKPYDADMFIRYLCSSELGAGSKKAFTTLAPISNRFRVKRLVYRYQTKEFFHEWGSPLLIIDILIFILRKTITSLLGILGILKYQKTGYTLVLVKE